MIVHRQEMRSRLGGVLRKLTHQPAFGQLENDEPDLVDEAQREAEPETEDVNREA